MDDTWVFLQGEKQFPPMLEAYQHAVFDGALRFTCHPAKCKPLQGEAAREAISTSVLDYARGNFDDPRSDDHEVAMELFEYAMDDPDQRRLELRAALGKIGSHKAQKVFDCLVADPSLLALAPSQWRKVVRSLLCDGKAVKRLEPVIGSSSRSAGRVARNRVPGGGARSGRRSCAQPEQG